jgi:hypothetical protein
LISQPPIPGTSGSRSETSERMMRLFAWPRSPSKITSWPEITAFASCGSTVSS